MPRGDAGKVVRRRERCVRTTRASRVPTPCGRSGSRVDERFSWRWLLTSISMVSGRALRVRAREGVKRRG
jgi:hypothetical protein